MSSSYRSCSADPWQSLGTLMDCMYITFQALGLLDVDVNLGTAMPIDRRARLAGEARQAADLMPNNIDEPEPESEPESCKWNDLRLVGHRQLLCWTNIGHFGSQDGGGGGSGGSSSSSTSTGRNS
mmetsp:Transcript_69421/g.175243  ORF Transcript_69421/g.175243 Transcript_69421/m.175243 type:complete len:125 (-) Transcript_69421:184-558(-)